MDGVTDVGLVVLQTSMSRSSRIRLSWSRTCRHARTAKLMEHVAVIRSMTSPLGEHNFGAHYLLTGYKPTPVLEYPSHGAVLAHVREQSGVLPPHVAVPSFRVGGGRMTGGGYLLNVPAIDLAENLGITITEPP